MAYCFLCPFKPGLAESVWRCYIWCVDQLWQVKCQVLFLVARIFKIFLSVNNWSSRVCVCLCPSVCVDKVGEDILFLVPRIKDRIGSVVCRRVEVRGRVHCQG